MYTMKGDRHYEYEFAGSFVGKVGPFDDKRHMLDVGSGTRAAMAKLAVSRGWVVEAVDLMPCDWRHTGFRMTLGDFRTVALARYAYDLIMCVSTIEHFGLPGRYDVTRYEVDADLEGMARIRKVCADGAQVVLTIPVGYDAVLSPYHRVYGVERLPRLLEGFKATQQKFFRKEGGVDDYVPCSYEEAMDEEPLLEPAHYAALGCFVLERRG